MIHVGRPGAVSLDPPPFATTQPLGIPSNPLAVRANPKARSPLSMTPGDLSRKPLPCVLENVKVIKRPGVPDTYSMQPPTGYGNGQLKGLSYWPIDLPVMPQAGYFFPGMNNVLGN